MIVDAEERQNLLENDENEIDEHDREIPEVNVKPESEAIGFIQAVKIPGVIPVRTVSGIGLEFFSSLESGFLWALHLQSTV